MMSRVAAVFLLALVSASAFRLPAAPRNRLAIGKQAKDALDTLHLILSQISDVEPQHQQQIQDDHIGKIQLQELTRGVNDAPANFDELLKELEAAFDTLLDKLAPLLDLTAEQVAQAKADIDTLIKDLEAIRHGASNVDGGVTEIVVDIFSILEDFGVLVQSEETSELTTPKSDLDKLLEELEELLLVTLPALAPELGITPAQVFAIEKNFRDFVDIVEGMEHGTIEVEDGIIYIIVDILNVLEAFDIDYTNPTDDTPTSTDEFLDQLQKIANKLLETIGPIKHMTPEAIEMFETDIDNIIKDFKAIEHGEIDFDHGTQAFLLDLLKLIQDAVPVPAPEAMLQVGVPAQLSALERQLTSFVTSLPPAARATVRADLHQLAEVIHLLTSRYF